MSVAITFEIEVECDQCGNDLDVSFNGNVLSVDPCETCLNNERSKGHDEGYDEGYDEGKEEGYGEGYKKGFDDGVNSVKENKE